MYMNALDTFYFSVFLRKSFRIPTQYGIYYLFGNSYNLHIKTKVKTPFSNIALFLGNKNMTEIVPMQDC